MYPSLSSPLVPSVYMKGPAGEVSGLAVLEFVFALSEYREYLTIREILEMLKTILPSRITSPPMVGM